MATFLPDETDTLLLRAALLRGDAAREAWAQLRPTVDLDRLSVHWFRLVPLLYRNLLALGITDPDMPRIKGIYRNAWVRNQLLLRDVGLVLGALRAADIDTVLLKGAALAGTAYGDVGARPMNDFDVLVPIDRAMPAVEVLENLGWRCQAEHWLAFSLRYWREAEMHKAGGFKCDIHWHLLEELVLPDTRTRSSDDFWEAAEEIEVAGAPTRVLGPADQMLHLCVHGPVWYSGTHVHWAADAVKVIEWAGSRLDWDRLVTQATARNAVLPVKDALRYLASGLDAPVPADVVDRLDRVTVTRRVERAYRVRPVRGRWGRAGQALNEIEAYVSLTSAWRPWQAIAEAPRYFARRGGVWLAQHASAGRRP